MSAMEDIFGNNSCARYLELYTCLSWREYSGLRCGFSANLCEGGQGNGF
jgi:hypothetical protein